MSRVSLFVLALALLLSTNCQAQDKELRSMGFVVLEGGAIGIAAAAASNAIMDGREWIEKYRLGRLSVAQGLNKTEYRRYDSLIRRGDTQFITWQRHTTTEAMFTEIIPSKTRSIARNSTIKHANRFSKAAGLFKGAALFGLASVLGSAFSQGDSWGPSQWVPAATIGAGLGVLTQALFNEGARLSFLRMGAAAMGGIAAVALLNYHNS